ncbi:protein fantom-like [Arapaima gigas]
MKGSLLSCVVIISAPEVGVLVQLCLCSCGELKKIFHYAADVILDAWTANPWLDISAEGKQTDWQTFQRLLHVFLTFSEFPILLLRNGSSPQNNLWILIGCHSASLEMPLAVDETAGDLPVRDMGSRGAMTLPLQVTDSTRDVKSCRKPQVLRIKGRCHTFCIPGEQLEDQCFRLQEENILLKQHTRAQELKIHRMSTKLLRLQKGRPGTGGTQERELDETIQGLETRVAILESQKGLLQSKLSLARHHIMDLGRSHYRPRASGKGAEVRKAARTAPPRCDLGCQDPHGEMHRPSSGMDTQQARLAELELETQSVRDMLREREREIEDAMQALREQQAEGHRMAIKENVDAIRLQKQLSEKGAALLVMQEKFNVLQEVCCSLFYEFLWKSQKSLKESQQVLLMKVEELREQLREEREKAMTQEGQLTAATLSLQALDELQTRVADLEGERDLLKESYNRLLDSTMSTQVQHNESDGHLKEEHVAGGGWRVELQKLEESLRAEQEDKERLQMERERIMEEWKRERETCEKLQEKIRSLEQDISSYQKEVASLQERLDSVTKEFDISVEDLSDTLLQIKAFRLKREEQEKLRFLGATGTVENWSREAANLQASHAETVLELQKTREMLLLQSRIHSHLQSEVRSLREKAERQQEENKVRMTEKDKLLERRAQRITTLQGQLRDLAYSPRSYKRTIPVQYTWTGDVHEAAEPTEDDAIFRQLQSGESLLEIHLRGASFTPAGLRTMKYGLEGSKSEGVGQDVVTFCTYSLLDFEIHATALLSGPQPNYGFTSRYPLSPLDLKSLTGRSGGLKVELHQSLGGVRFITRGRAWIPVSGAFGKRGERVYGRANITGLNDEIVGVLDFWVCLYAPVEPAETGQGDRWAKTLPGQWSMLNWDYSRREQMFDYGGGVPNELEVVLERCVGLGTRWPGVLPHAYLLYRLYDLPPHVTPTISCSSDPVYNDMASYPLAVTRDVLAYLQEGSLWVYAFDDSDDRPLPSYLAKTPIPLKALAMGRHIRGDFVLRDAGGSPRGIVRVSLRWRYPFQAPEALQKLKDVDRQERRRQGRTEKTLDRPIAKPRVKHSVSVSYVVSFRNNVIVTDHLDTDVMESSESGTSSGSDVIIIPEPHQPASKGNKLRVEILSLSLHPTSRVALDQSVQRIYVEYRLLGVPMETTETPMSLRKPTAGEEIHYNFTRVIYVDSAEAAPLRWYLYTMLEGSDPNQGRLKFTVVSEPMNEQEEECADIGYAYLDLQELLLTGNDVTERQLDIVSVGDGVHVEVIGKLKVSLEAAQTLTGIYWQFQSQREREPEKDRGKEEERRQGGDMESVQADDNHNDDV